MFFKPKRIKELENEIESLKDQIIEYKHLYEFEKETSEILLNNISKKIKETNNILKENIKMQKEKDEKIDNLKEEFNELSSKVYLRVPLKPQRIPKAEPMKIKSFAKTSNIARKHKMEIENELN